MSKDDQLSLFATPTAPDTVFDGDEPLSPLDWNLWFCGNCGVATRLSDVFADHNPDGFWTTDSDKWVHRHGPPIIVGEAPGPNTDRRCAMYPLPERSAGGRLCAMLGMEPRTYLRRFHRANVLLDYPGKDKWDTSGAARGAGAIGQLARGRVVFACGRRIVIAFAHAFPGVNAKMDPLDSVVVPGFKFRLVHVPHPSGLNQWYNGPDAAAKVLAVFEEYAGWVFEDEFAGRRNEYAVACVGNEIVRSLADAGYAAEFVRDRVVPALNVGQFAPFDDDDLLVHLVRRARLVADALLQIHHDEAGTHFVTAEEFSDAFQTRRGYLVYMIGKHEDQPHVPDEQNPFTDERARAEWDAGYQRAVLEVQDAES